MAEVQARDPRAERVALVRGHVAVEIAPGLGGRIASLLVDGWDVVRRDGWTDNEWGIFVMAPWAGRLRGAHVAWAGRTWDVPATEPPHALHGLVASAPWAVAAATRHTVRLERDLGPGWPTGGRVVHTVALEADRLVLRLQVHAGLEPTPAILGWHPWFRRVAVRHGDVNPESGAPVLVESRPARVAISARRRVGLDSSGLPDGRLLEPRDAPVDDVLLGVTEPPVVTWPGGPSLTLRAPGAAAWIAYTAHPDGVCVEPVTGIPDGINGGLLGDPPVAAPRAPLDVTFEIAWG